MSIGIDHVGVPAKYPDESAQLLRDILGLGSFTAEGPNEEMVNLSIGDGSLTYFHAPTPYPHHIALRVSAEVFNGAIERLKERNRPFGNDPGDTANGSTSGSTSGGWGRIYFRDTNGHLFRNLRCHPRHLTVPRSGEVALEIEALVSDVVTVSRPVGGELARTKSRPRLLDGKRCEQGFYCPPVTARNPPKPMSRGLAAVWRCLECADKWLPPEALGSQMSSRRWVGPR